MTDATWKLAINYIEEALGEMDRGFSEQGTPLTLRPKFAKEMVFEYVVQVTDEDRKAFLLSEAHGRILMIVDNWFKRRYGELLSDPSRNADAAIMVRGVPCAMKIPLEFSKPGDLTGSVWFSMPSTVQVEENPLDWIAGPIGSLTDAERSEVSREAQRTANNIRSIHFDLRALRAELGENELDLCESVIADMTTAARLVCDHNNALSRNTGWQVSQAIEKCMKLFILRTGNTPKYTHNLEKLALRCETLGAAPIDRVALGRVPSDSDATNLRYSGEYSADHAVSAYSAAVQIISELTQRMCPQNSLRLKEARFLLKPPWFDFDTKAFNRTLSDS